MTLELNFTNPPENASELIVLGERMSSVAVDKFGVVWYPKRNVDPDGFHTRPLIL